MAPANSLSFSQLTQQHDFINRHIGLRADDIEYMLSCLSLDSLDQLIHQAVPHTIHLSATLDLPDSRTEQQVTEELKAIATKNKLTKSFIGMGYHPAFTPKVIQRNLLENPGWYTAYTPYQAEISQGRLQGLLNFQQMLVDLTGMELANASLLDEATAAAEAMTLCQRVSRKKCNNFFIADHCHPQTIEVVKTRADSLGINTILSTTADIVKHEVFAVLVQYPDTLGHITDLQQIIQQARQQQALVIVATDLMSLTLIKPPGEWGADVVVGSSQRFGMPLYYGGPHAAFMATREKYKRAIPGRIIGVSKDSNGQPALRMALQTREQHIRREKATSNICTAQALPALVAAFYACYHGPHGLKTIGQRIHRLTAILASGLEKLGYQADNSRYFDTLSYTLAEENKEAIYHRAIQQGINLRKLANGLAISLNETATKEDILSLLTLFAGHSTSVDSTYFAELDEQISQQQDMPGISPEFIRSSGYLQHEVFTSYHSETDMLRYLKRLQDQDIALDRAMIPLGSCTMKLNATVEMEPLGWPEFANIHPFAPLDQAQGYQQLFAQLTHQLCVITGFSAVSLQPNAGSQGEYAGLLTIRHYQQSIGQHERDICLIPRSAHGTNPASAVLAGLKVVLVDCDNGGNVDSVDLTAKVEQYSKQLCCLMVTYPSTHGVFEEHIIEICQTIHQHGGQVYFDGANMNALVGIASPAEIGADVIHLNLHKTFCIPHGGGGPGCGPIAVAQHLAPFLPNHSVQKMANLSDNTGAIAAAPWGSAGILSVTWAYIRLMGAKGLQKASQIAILSANYIAHQLAPYYPILFSGNKHRVAHECIIDLRPLKAQTGISEEDIAKRLIDYGFHAPTMSFPVAGTLMIEPTESESLQEIERFCQAMIAIRQEVDQVAQGVWPMDNNPLVNAPHKAEDIAVADWPHPYSREQACWPLGTHQQTNKYWPPVKRVDQVYGDRHLFCGCPAIESYASKP
jgi:glycine dehydrogenase